jgi:phenol 2-monooxygenase
MVADAKPVHLGHTVEADGRWRLFAFVATEDPVGPSSGLRTLWSRK